MKCPGAVPGHKRLYGQESANGKTDQPHIKTKVTVFLQYSAVHCSIFDIQKDSCSWDRSTAHMN